MTTVNTVLFEMANGPGGVNCPCCGQHAQVYRRTLNAGIAAGLIGLYTWHGTEWAHLRTAVGGTSNHVASAAWWGLLAEEPGARPDGGRSGWWRLTDAGEAFVKGLAVIPKYALVYNGKVLDLEPPHVSIRECLGQRFNYADLMAGVRS